MFSFLYHCRYFKRTWLYIWVARCVSYKKHMVHPRFLVGSMLLIFVIFLCVCFLFCLSSSCVLCTKSCKFLSIGHSWFSLRFSLAFIYRYIVCKWGKWIKRKGTEISVNSLWLFHFTTCFCLNFVRLLHLLVTVLPDKAWVSFYDFSIDLALLYPNQFNSLDIKKQPLAYCGKHMTASFH
jgi:hypothetical protein